MTLLVELGILAGVGVALVVSTTTVRHWIIAACLLVVVLLLFAGCATMDHATASAQQKQKDEVECRALSEQGVPPGRLLRNLAVQELFKTCLASRGWEKV